MKIHELPADPGIQQKPKRRGRGESSGLGKSAGKGNKGQQSRSGSGKGSGFEGGQMPLIRRVPKRGFHNPFRVTARGINLAALEKHFEAGATVDPEALLQAGLIKASEKRIKILGDGALTKSLTVKAHAFSESAKEKITAAGGTAEVI